MELKTDIATEYSNSNLESAQKMKFEISKSHEWKIGFHFCKYTVYEMD